MSESNFDRMTHQGVAYIDTIVRTKQDFMSAMKLASLTTSFPYEEKDLKDFIYDVKGGSTEAWLLKSRSPRVPQHRLDFPAPPADSSLAFPYPPKYASVWSQVEPQALLLLYLFCDQDPECPDEELDDPESLVVSVEALCSDPWMDQAFLATWTDKRLQSLSRASGGAYELRVSVPERNIPLIEGFKKLGYFCFGYDPDPTHFKPCNKVQDGFGELYFGKLLRVRGRHKQGRCFLSPKLKRGNA